MRQITYRSKDIKKAIDFLQFGKLPEGLSRAQRFRFRNRYLSGYSVEKRTKKSKLGRKTRLRLLYKGKLVVPRSQITSILTKLYSHAESSRNGIHSFFDQVRQRVEGITRAQVYDFLNSQKNYQRFKPEKKKLPQSIIVKRPLEQIQMDFIDLSNYEWVNLGYKYVLVLVDGFSKYVWLYPTKSRDAEEQKFALEHLINEMGTIPKVLHSDGEFKSKIIRNLAQKYKFRAVFSSPYNPNANSIVESLNKTLKNMIYQWMDKHSTKVWIDSLQAISYNLNHTKHGTTKKRPVDLIDAKSDQVKKVNKQLAKNRKRKIEKIADKIPEKEMKLYKKGDKVRISRMVFPETRKELLTGRKKSYNPRWSEKVYTIKTILRPKTEGRIPEYILEELSKKIRHDHILKVDKVQHLEDTKTPVYHSEFYNRERSAVKRRRIE